MSTSDGNPSRGKAYHHGDLRAALVRAGRELLREEGLSGLTLRRVSGRAGVSVAAPYRHFENGDALIGAVLADGFRGLSDQLTAAPTSDPIADLHSLGHRFVDLIIAEPELFRLIASALGGANLSPELATAERSAAAAFTRALSRANDAGQLNVESTAAELTMHCVMQGLASLISGGRIPLDEAHRTAELIMSTVDRGLFVR